MNSTKWHTFGKYCWTTAIVDICLRYECGSDSSKLEEMLHSYYGQYAWPA